MPLRRKRRDPSRTHGAAPQTDDGHYQALDQMAQWVRFADVKATILFASLGAVLTLVATSSTSIAAALRIDSTMWVIGGLLVALALVVLFTLSQLLWAVNPRSKASGTGLNRFAWPTLRGADAATLAERAARTDPTQEAWTQVVDLADIAGKKFSATRRAAWGLGASLVLSLVLLSVAVGVETAQPSENCECASETPSKTGQIT